MFNPLARAFEEMDRQQELEEAGNKQNKMDPNQPAVKVNITPRGQSGQCSVFRILVSPFQMRPFSQHQV